MTIHCFLTMMEKHIMLYSGGELNLVELENDLTAIKPGAEQKFPLTAVHLLESPFKKARDVDAAYILALAGDRLLDLFLKRCRH